MQHGIIENKNNIIHNIIHILFYFIGDIMKILYGPQSILNAVIPDNIQHTPHDCHDNIIHTQHCIIMILMIICYN